MTLSLENDLFTDNVTKVYSVLPKLGAKSACHPVPVNSHNGEKVEMTFVGKYRLGAKSGINLNYPRNGRLNIIVNSLNYNNNVKTTAFPQNARVQCSLFTSRGSTSYSYFVEQKRLFIIRDLLHERIKKFTDFISPSLI